MSRESRTPDGEEYKIASKESQAESGREGRTEDPTIKAREKEERVAAVEQRKQSDEKEIEAIRSDLGLEKSESLEDTTEKAIVLAEKMGAEVRYKNDVPVIKEQLIKDKSSGVLHIGTGKDFLRDLEAYPQNAKKFLQDLESNNKELLNVKIYRPESDNAQEDQPVYLGDYLEEISNNDQQSDAGVESGSVEEEYKAVYKKLPKEAQNLISEIASGYSSKNTKTQIREAVSNL